MQTCIRGALPYADTHRPVCRTGLRLQQETWISLTTHSEANLMKPMCAHRNVCFHTLSRVKTSSSKPTFKLSDLKSCPSQSHSHILH